MCPYTVKRVSLLLYVCMCPCTECILPYVFQVVAKKDKSTPRKKTKSSKKKRSHTTPREKEIAQKTLAHKESQSLLDERAEESSPKVKRKKESSPKVKRTKEIARKTREGKVTCVRHHQLFSVTGVLARRRNKPLNPLITRTTVTVSSQMYVCFILSESYSRDILTVDNMLI